VPAHGVHPSTREYSTPPLGGCRPGWESPKFPLRPFPRCQDEETEDEKTLISYKGYFSKKLPVGSLENLEMWIFLAVL
jgi:hypothetical protein